MNLQEQFQKYSPLILSLVSLSFIVLLTFSLRLQAANTMYLDNIYSDRDFDEMVYVPIAEAYAESIREFNLGEIIANSDNPEHPILSKILMGLGVLFFGEGTILNLDNLMATRLISILLATGVATLLWREFGFFPALFWAIASYSIKYTSQAYLEAALSFFALIALITLFHTRKAGDKWWILSAIFAAAAFASKYPGILAGGVVFILISLFQEEEKTHNFEGKLNISKFNISSFLNRRFIQKSLIWILLFTTAFCIFNPRVLGNPVDFVQSLLFHYDYSQGTDVQNSELLKQFDWLLGETNPTTWHEHFPIVYLDGLIFVGSIFGIVFLVYSAYNQETKEFSIKSITIILFYFVNLLFLILWQTKWPQYLTMFEIPMAISSGIFYTEILKFAILGESKEKRNLNLDSPQDSD